MYLCTFIVTYSRSRGSLHASESSVSLHASLASLSSLSPVSTSSSDSLFGNRSWFKELLYLSLLAVTFAILVYYYQCCYLQQGHEVQQGQQDQQGQQVPETQKDNFNIEGRSNSRDCKSKE